MKDNYEIQYEKIVKGTIPPRCSTPEEQGRKIQKCSILKNVEIEYAHINKIRGKDYDF